MKLSSVGTVLTWQFARGAALLSLAALAACGGGGDAPPAAAAPTVNGGGANPPAPPVAASTCGLPDFAASALARINQLRAAGADCRSAGRFAPAGALAWNALLTQAADGHSQDMAAKNYFSHTSADGRSLSDRITATGYAWSSIGENIAAGYSTVDIVMDGWMSSDGHCANIMNASFTEVGLACVPGTAGSSYSTYWTMDLAHAR